MRRSSHFNPKRNILELPCDSAMRLIVLNVLRDLSCRARYGGNPEHKKAPGDFGLTPPASPRRGKSLCDDSGITRRAEALALLRSGFARGMVDRRWPREGWPQLVWSVDNAGRVFEAQREGDGVYHGYPLPDADPLRDVVRRRWIVG